MNIYKSVQTDKIYENENQESTISIAKKGKKNWTTGRRPTTTYQVNGAKCISAIKRLKYGIDRGTQTVNQKKVVNNGTVMKPKHRSMLQKWTEGCYIDGQYFKAKVITPSAAATQEDFSIMSTTYKWPNIILVYNNKGKILYKADRWLRTEMEKLAKEGKKPLAVDPSTPRNV